MTSSPTTSELEQPHTFEVVILGRLSAAFTSTFEGLDVTVGQRTTTLSGRFHDQAQLYGVLERIADYGLELDGVTRVADPLPASGPVRSPVRRPLRRWAFFVVTFIAAWTSLELISVSPPTPIPAVSAFAVAALALVLGERLLSRIPIEQLTVSRSFGTARRHGLVVAALGGFGVVLAMVGGAAMSGTELTLRPNWVAVLLGVLIFHGLAEELVWRCFAFRTLRRVTTFWKAVLLSTPLIGMTHIPIVLSDGWTVGLLAVATAVVTCIPMAYAWEHGGRSIWAPALLHGLIGTWQVFDRTYPLSFSLIVLSSSILVPVGVVGIDLVRTRRRSKLTAGRTS